MKIGFDAKRYFHNHTGLGNYSRTLIGNIQKMAFSNEYRLYDEPSFIRTFMLGKKAKSDGCDLFHGLSNEIPVDIKIPSIVTIHDVAWRTFPKMYHLADRLIYDLKYGFSCKRATHVIAISESTKRDVMSFYGINEEKISVVYQPVQQNYYSPMLNEKSLAIVRSNLPLLPKDFILYVGSINARKNLLSLVQALKLIPKENRPFLLVIGNGREYRNKVEHYISTHDLGTYIQIESNIYDNKLLQSLYAQARAFVYPSFYEGFGLPVVEAALQATPVVTTTVSSLPEAAGPDACLINPHDKDASEQIANYIERLITDNEYHDAVGKKMQEYSKKMFSTDKFVENTIRLYETIVKQS